MSKPGFFAWYEWRHGISRYKGKKPSDPKLRPKGLSKLIPPTWWLKDRKLWHSVKPAPTPAPTPTPKPKPKPKPAPWKVTQGVDGVSVPTGAQLRANGKHFVFRYLSTPGNPKNIRSSEIEDFHRHGIAIGLVYETTGQDFYGGFAAGQRAAKSALQQMGALRIGRVNKDGTPVAVYFAIDVDPHGHEDIIVGYIRGAASVLGKEHTGVYGGISAVTACYDHAACHFFWQAYAWSYGRWSPHAHVEQYLNGQRVAGHSVDLDRQMKARAGLYLP